MKDRETFRAEKAAMKERLRAEKREWKEKYRASSRHYHHHHHPIVNIGLFLIVLGVALLVATNDLLDLGSIERYFTWQTAMIFVGTVLLVTRHFTGGILLIAAGLWFYMDEIYYGITPFIKTVYWPGVIILIGLVYIVSSLFRHNRYVN